MKARLTTRWRVHQRLAVVAIFSHEPMDVNVVVGALPCGLYDVDLLGRASTGRPGDVDVASVPQFRRRTPRTIHAGVFERVLVVRPEVIEDLEPKGNEDRI